MSISVKITLTTGGATFDHVVELDTDDPEDTSARYDLTDALTNKIEEWSPLEIGDTITIRRA